VKAALPEIALTPGTCVIADLHLDPLAAGPWQAFRAWLARLEAPMLLVLGDLFEYWIGPAQARDAQYASLLAELRARGTEKAVLVNFWATWCGTCLAEMPELVQLQRELGPRGVRLVAVSFDLLEPAQVKTAEQLGAFAEHHGYELPLVAFRGDREALASSLHLPSGPPVTLLLDRDGNELGRIEGPGERAEFEALLAKVR